MDDFRLNGLTVPGRAVAEPRVDLGVEGVDRGRAVEARIGENVCAAVSVCCVRTVPLHGSPRAREPDATRAYVGRFGAKGWRF